MLDAFTDQVLGNSTPRCSKLTDPSRQFVMTTARRSQVTSSYGCTPAVVYTRSIRSPLRRLDVLAWSGVVAEPLTVSVMRRVLTSQLGRTNRFAASMPTRGFVREFSSVLLKCWWLLE